MSKNGKYRQEEEDLDDEDEKPRKRGRPRKEDKEREARFDIAQETKNSIWGVAAFSLMLVSLLSFIDKAGRGGEAFNNISRTLFGYGFFIIPIALAFLGISFFKSIHRKIYSTALLGTCLFVLTFLGGLYIYGSGEIPARVVHGGYLGVILGYPLLSLVGFTAAAIILLALAIIALLVSMDISFFDLIGKKRAEEAKPEENVIVKKGNEIMQKPDFK